MHIVLYHLTQLGESRGVNTALYHPGVHDGTVCMFGLPYHLYNAHCSPSSALLGGSTRGVDTGVYVWRNMTARACSEMGVVGPLFLMSPLLDCG